MQMIHDAISPEMLAAFKQMSADEDKRHSNEDAQREFHDKVRKMADDAAEAEDRRMFEKRRLARLTP